MKQFTILLLGVCLMASCNQPPPADNAAGESKNQTLETIFNRKSVRTYTDQPVEQEKIDILMRAGMSAPSSMDRRPWEFIIVTDRDKLNTLAEGLPFAKMLTSTHQAIVVCGNTELSGNSWFMDCSAASQNILLAAESMGLGAVWTGVFPSDERIALVRSTLQLPENIIPLNVIPIGYPGGDEQPKDKFDATRIHRNTW